MLSDDARTAHAIEATGRKKLIFAGLSLEGLRRLSGDHGDQPGTRRLCRRRRLRDLQRHQAAARHRTIDAGGRDRLRLRDLDDGGDERQQPAEAGAVYGAIDMDWAKLVGQLAHAYGK